MSENTALQILDCSGNLLDSLDASGNATPINLSCSNNDSGRLAELRA